MYCSAASMTSVTSMIMEQAVMPINPTKYNHKHQSFYQTHRPPYFWTRYLFPLLLQNIGLHTSGQDINSLYFCKLSASILLEQDMPYSSEYLFPLLLQNIGLHTSGQDINSLYFCKISASILLDKISILFTFANYRPPYFWNKICLTQVRYTTKMTLLVNFWSKLYSKSL